MICYMIWYEFVMKEMKQSMHLPLYFSMNLKDWFHQKDHARWPSMTCSDEVYTL